ncbi:uncharacterized protein K02A2.6-like [Achroia grisella]|nr:uncharacterized protein K02A2.6-like [Achroia grisella]
MEAIRKLPHPSDISELRSFLGFVNFYSKFIKNISSILVPLYWLLKKGVTWEWTKECEAAFTEIKSILMSGRVLAHYDPDKPLYLTCDASARGIGGVLTQRDGASGTERPVVFVSRALSDAEKHYAQIDREALAIVFCLQKLHQYVYGRRFILRTDHKPLVSIFGPKHGIPAMAASRLQRWAIKIAAYSYEIEYVNTKDNAADGLSRLPIQSKFPSSLPEQTYLHFAHNALLMDHSEIKLQTQRDSILSRILCYIRDGWPSVNEVRTIQPFFNRKTELYEELGCIMWGHRVVVPECCRSVVLAELHEPHMGIVKTKALARSYVWWPGIDEAIEQQCRMCNTCAAEADAPPRHAPTPWPWPTRPWSRIHMDFLGPINNKIYLVIVDAHTKWLEVFQVPSTAAVHCIAKLSELFARWGIPKQIVSDNGPPFSSYDFEAFTKSLGIIHLHTAPYHPASNGAAENAVRTIKRVIKKALRDGTDINLSINFFLLHYRNIAHCTTGECPASLMLGRRLRTKLDVLRPNLENKLSQARQRKQQREGVALEIERKLKPGDEIWLRQYSGAHKWLPGTVTERLGTTDYKVCDTSGRESHRHIDQLKRRSRSSVIGTSSLPSDEGAAGDWPEGSNENPGRYSVDKEDRELKDTNTMDRIGELEKEGRVPSPVAVDEEPKAEKSSSPPTQSRRPIRQCRLNKRLIN